jgi:hypothetical protein
MNGWRPDGASYEFSARTGGLPVSLAPIQR